MISYDNNQLCQHYLDILYEGAVGHCEREKNNNMAETYGEILYPSVDKLLSKIQLSNEDVFVDLGSGLGKLALQVFLKSHVKEVCGIEIVPELHVQALKAALRVQSELPGFYQGDRKLTFLCDDFLEISLATATVVLICSPCFSQDIVYSLGEKINNTPSIRTVLALRPMPTLRHLSFKKTIRLECSWDTALCYVYE